LLEWSKKECHCVKYLLRSEIINKVDIANVGIMFYW